MSIVWLVVGILVVWRITHLVQAEDGPWQLLARLRRSAGAGFFGELVDCFYCASLWVGLPVAFGISDSCTQSFLLWPALSGGAILLERLTVTRVPGLRRAFTAH